MGRRFIVCGLLSLLALAGVTVAGEVGPAWLQGKVECQDGEGSSLSARWLLAQQRQAAARSGLLLAGYAFNARPRVQLDHRTYNCPSPRLVEVDIGGERLTANGHDFNENFFDTTDDRSLPAKPASPRMGIILLFKRERNGWAAIDAGVLSRAIGYRFSSMPIYWLGESESQESYRFLKEIFLAGRCRQRLLLPLALQPIKEVWEFLADIARGSHPLALRKDAIFWIGAFKEADGLRQLRLLQSRQLEVELRKQLVFSFYLNGSDEALTQVLALAKKGEHAEIRREAIFWLGQAAAVRSAPALREIIDGDDDRSLKKHAVFALSQLPTEQSFPALMDIARRHADAEIKKTAIFWLGESGDPRALDFFEEILGLKH